MIKIIFGRHFRIYKYIVRRRMAEPYYIAQHCQPKRIYFNNPDHLLFDSDERQNVSARGRECAMGIGLNPKKIYINATLAIWVSLGDFQIYCTVCALQHAMQVQCVCMGCVHLSLNGVYSFAFRGITWAQFLTTCVGIQVHLVAVRPSSLWMDVYIYIQLRICLYI